MAPKSVFNVSDSCRGLAMMDPADASRPSRHVHLRRATPADAPLLRYWDAKPHVVSASGADGSPDFDWEYELPRDVVWRELLIGEADGRPIGFMQIIDPQLEETHYWGDVGNGLRAIDIWIGEEADLGQGYGTGMMQLALDRSFSDPRVDAVLIDPVVSNTLAQRFMNGLVFAWSSGACSGRMIATSIDWSGRPGRSTPDRGVCGRLTKNSGGSNSSALYSPQHPT